MGHSSKNLTCGDGSLALLGHLKALGQRLPAGQHQSGQETARRGPQPVQPLSNVVAQISQRCPWTLQYFDALDPS